MAENYHADKIFNKGHKLDHYKTELQDCIKIYDPERKISLLFKFLFTSEAAQKYEHSLLIGSSNFTAKKAYIELK